MAASDSETKRRWCRGWPSRSCSIALAVISPSVSGICRHQEIKGDPTNRKVFQVAFNAAFKRCVFILLLVYHSPAHHGYIWCPTPDLVVPCNSPIFVCQQPVTMDHTLLEG